MGKYQKGKTDYLDPDKLYEQYQPLMGSIYARFSKYNGIFHCQADYEDLKSQIELEFARLCHEFNPARGVDFPGYVKIHLQQRVYHYITKLQRRLKYEGTIVGKTYDDSDNPVLDFDNTTELIDEESIKAFERVEALASLDWRAILGKKHKRMIECVLYEHKTLEEIAEQEGVAIKVVRLRLHFACERLKQWYQRQEEYQAFRALNPGYTFEDFMAYKRQVSKIPRQPIILGLRQPIVADDEPYDIPLF